MFQGKSKVGSFFPPYNGIKVWDDESTANQEGSRGGLRDLEGFRRWLRRHSK